MLCYSGVLLCVCVCVHTNIPNVMLRHLCCVVLAPTKPPRAGEVVCLCTQFTWPHFTRILHFIHIDFWCCTYIFHMKTNPIVAFCAERSTNRRPIRFYCVYAPPTTFSVAYFVASQTHSLNPEPTHVRLSIELIMQCVRASPLHLYACCMFEYVAYVFLHLHNHPVCAFVSSVI